MSLNVLDTPVRPCEGQPPGTEGNFGLSSELMGTYQYSDHITSVGKALAPASRFGRHQKLEVAYIFCCSFVQQLLYSN